MDNLVYELLVKSQRLFLKEICRGKCQAGIRDSYLYYGEIPGKDANVDIEQGTPITWELVKEGRT